MATPMTELDATNKSMVGVQGDNIVILKYGIKLSKADAINLAAWIVVLGDPDDDFGLLIEKVQNT